MATKNEVQRERAEIFKTIYGVKKGLFSEVLAEFERDYRSVKNKGLAKIQELYKKYSYAIFFMYSPSSIRNNLVKFKNIIKKEGGKYQAVALDTFTIEAIYSPIKKRDDDRKERGAERAFKGKVTSIREDILIEQIESIKKELDSRSYNVAKNQKEEQVRAYRILFMLALSTGRRFTELMKTLVIVKRGKKITFNGLLKGNDKPIEGFIIGLTYKEVQSFLKELRAFVKTENMTESQINAKYAKVFNNALKRFAKQGLIKEEILNHFYSVEREVRGKLVKGEPNIKGCRDIYAKVGAKLFNNPKIDRDYTQTASRILGHRYIIQSSEGYLNK